MKDEALKLALEALNLNATMSIMEWHNQRNEAITAIKQALNDAAHLAAPVQEPKPVCWDGEDKCPNRQACCDAQHCLYTTPPNVATPLAAQRPVPEERKWVGLTDAEIRQDASWFFPSEWWAVCKDFARTIESELKEKNSD